MLYQYDTKGKWITMGPKTMFREGKDMEMWVNIFDKCLPKPFVTSASALEGAQYFFFHFLSQLEN